MTDENGTTSRRPSGFVPWPCSMPSRTRSSSSTRTATSPSPTGKRRPFSAPAPTYLARHDICAFIPFGSPLLTLIDQVRERRAPSTNTASICVRRGWAPTSWSISMWRRCCPSPAPSSIVFQERSMADKIDRQLTHRAAARSVTGLASMLAHEIKNPLSGIRGAAQLLETSVNDEDRALTRLICDETDRIVSLVDRMEVFSDERPVDRQPINIHSVLDHVKAIAKAGFARNIRITENYDPSLPPVYANRDQLIQVFLNLVKNAAEAVADTTGRRDHADDGLSARHPPLGRRHARKDFAAARILRSSTTAPACPPIWCRICSIRSSPPRPTGPASASPWSPRSSAAMAASSNATARPAARHFAF